MSDILTDEAIKFIEKHKERPFFLYFATHGIHEPRVPFIVRWPGHVPAGETSAVLLSQTDLLASCARLLGTKLPNGAARDSAEVLDALLGKSRVRRHEWVVNQFNAKCALRVDNWKWVEGQLFDLSSDLSETRNLVGEQPRRAKAMSARLIELMK
jgi:arylsulfatase A-like enzyme